MLELIFLVLFVLFLVIHWIVLFTILTTKNNTWLKALSFSLLSVELVFVIGNLLFNR
jgi:hypothetical protein